MKETTISYVVLVKEEKRGKRKGNEKQVRGRGDTVCSINKKMKEKTKKMEEGKGGHEKRKGKGE